MVTRCDHAFEETDIKFSLYGSSWIHVLALAYCPRCRRFGTRVTLYLDGKNLLPPAEIKRANEKHQARMRAERGAWLREHYPEHVQEESDNDPQPNAASTTR